MGCLGMIGAPMPKVATKNGEHLCGYLPHISAPITTSPMGTHHRMVWLVPLRRTTYHHSIGKYHHLRYHRSRCYCMHSMCILQIGDTTYCR